MAGLVFCIFFLHNGAMKKNIIWLVVGLVVLIGAGILAYPKIRQKIEEIRLKGKEEQRLKDKERNDYFLSLSEQTAEWLWSQKDEYYLATDWSSCDESGKCRPNLQGIKREGVIRSAYQETIPVIWGYFKYFDQTGNELAKVRSRSMLNALYYNVVLSEGKYKLQSDSLSCALLNEIATSNKADSEMREMADQVCAYDTPMGIFSESIVNVNLDEYWQRYLVYFIDQDWSKKAKLWPTLQNFYNEVSADVKGEISNQCLWRLANYLYDEGKVAIKGTPTGVYCGYMSYIMGEKIDKEDLNVQWQRINVETTRRTFEQAMMMGLLAIDQPEI